MYILTTTVQIKLNLSPDRNCIIFNYNKRVTIQLMFVIAIEMKSRDELIKIDTKQTQCIVYRVYIQQSHVV